MFDITSNNVSLADRLELWDHNTEHNVLKVCFFIMYRILTLNHNIEFVLKIISCHSCLYNKNGHADFIRKVDIWTYL